MTLNEIVRLMQRVWLHVQTPSCDSQEAIRSAVFEGPQGLMGAVGGDPRDCTVLVAGLPGRAAAELSKQLAADGVGGERVLFCELF